jgi:hypothetical protein
MNRRTMLTMRERCSKVRTVCGFEYMSTYRLR